ncbi:MAG: N-acetylneuraminate synthase [Nitrosarchaeum sp.]|nr:MAG: N-acetylneuraminate synthase [Nitrosarchaeum sp.]
MDGKQIGSRTYFIAEAGLNHNGDIKIAKKLVEEAYNAGADAIKFQTYKTENFITESNPYFKFFKKVEINYNEFGEIKDHAKNIGITFFSTPFDIESVDYLDKIKVPCFKIASSDITNMPLIRHIAKKNKPTIISTGSSTLQEIQDSINWCMFEGLNKIALLHCVVNYPASPDESNLLSIITLKNKFGLSVGYSDNGDSKLVDLVAVSIGAEIIEKHFTLDKKMDGPDHSFSIQPNDLKKLIDEIKVVEIVKGDGIKIPQKSEISIRNIARRSIIAKDDIKKGDEITANVLSIKRPSDGIPPKYYDVILGKRAFKDIKKDTPVNWKDIM